MKKANLIYPEIYELELKYNKALKTLRKIAKFNATYGFFCELPRIAQRAVKRLENETITNDKNKRSRKTNVPLRKV